MEAANDSMSRQTKEPKTVTVSLNPCDPAEGMVTLSVWEAFQHIWEHFDRAAARITELEARLATQHVHPAGSVREHTLTDAECWCKPKVEISEAGRLIIHRWENGEYVIP